MSVKLKKGTCAALLLDQPLPGRFVQVISIEKLEVLGGINHYMVEITDSFESIPVMLSSDLGALVASGKIAACTLMEIMEYICCQIYGMRIVIIESITCLALAASLPNKPTSLNVVQDVNESLNSIIEKLGGSVNAQDAEKVQDAAVPYFSTSDESQDSTSHFSTDSSIAAEANKTDNTGYAAVGLEEEVEDCSSQLQHERCQFEAEMKESNMSLG
ncbi:hypothetical protein CALVIDRAFT_563962 [Calocera viscosa TUFC12733]|uniref:Replication factor-A protein 1 N-terminal domain-containing protein n=1 Tax=Calocera viscosa (strain TUFC12733) TaxID=1330018 RepID=A0A167M9L3_CALVF|nr:hypothetical protein CALVIDRAFT_563962 [Calocera viscosa TUFC12733]